MAGESPTIPLSELCTRITKGTTPTTLGHPFVDRGVNFVKSEAITDDGRIDTSTFAFIDVKTHEALERSILQEGDILFSMAGVYLGKTAVVPRDILPANTNQAVGIIRLDDTKAVPRFIHYVLSSPDCRGLVHRSVAQSAQPNFNLRDIGGLPVPALSIPEQRAIAHILGTLDDKIELNRRMNETLEAIAQALFKSWFVDFDPVRAKAEGRDPGLPKPITDLFPDSFEDSDLGEIPKGWRVGTLADVAEVNAWTLGREDSLEVIDYIEISEVMRGEVANIVRYDRGCEPSRARRRLRHGDTVLSTVRPDRGARFLCLSPAETLIASTGFAVLTPRDGHWAFLHSAVLRREVSDELGRLADGGAYPAVRPEAIAGLKVVVPAGPILTAFEKFARPAFERAVQNRSESKTLTVLRDTLLPKLISGELRVLNGERIFTGADA